MHAAVAEPLAAGHALDHAGGVVDAAVAADMRGEYGRGLTAGAKC